MNDVLHLLMVEDSSLDAELTLSRLDMAGVLYDVRMVDNANDFVDALNGAAFDIVLADFVLPQFSGSEALALAREHAPEIPFIFVSGVLGEEHAVDMLKRGATDYVLKQRLQRLPAVIERALAEREERRQRRQAETRLRETETHFRQLVDALKDYAVLTLDVRGHIRTWNNAAQSMLGYMESDVVGLRAHRLLGNTGGLGDSRDAPDVLDATAADSGQGLPEQRADALDLALREATRAGSRSDERWLTRRDGQRVFASIVTTAMRDADGALTGFSLIARDMTQARRAADALQRAKEDAERANRAKDHFLAVLSHELRTPLTPILAAARLIGLKGGLSAEHRHLLDVVQRNVELEARLIDDLLDLTSIARGKLSLNFAPIALQEVVDNAVEMSAADIASKQQTLVIRREASQSQVRGDGARLQQIVWNLVKNAVKFTPAQGHIVVTLSNPTPANVAVAVVDTGIGISADALPKIFSAFEQADETISPAFGGLGLGLAIAQTLARKHGGTIEATSSGRGQGACFTFIMPLAAAATTAAPVVPAAARDSSAKRSLRVLLVEDNEYTSQAMAQLIDVFGHHADVAGSVAQARARIDCGTYDLLISDIGLPDGSGLDVVHHWHAAQVARPGVAPGTTRGSLPSIAITGYGMEEDRRRCLAAGFSNHLTKPVDFDHLEAMLERIARGGNPV